MAVALDPSDFAALIQQQLGDVHEFTSKTLHIASVQADEFGAKCGRPYHYLGSGWGLTSLDSGHPFFVNTYDRSITPWLLMSGGWEPHVSRVIAAYLKPGDAAIDVGAYVGYFTVKMTALIGGGGRLWAFDPNPEIAPYCIENIRLNGQIQNASFHQVALSDYSGRATLRQPTANKGQANIVDDFEADRTVEVEVNKLDDLGLIDRPMDFIKIDAEGSEAQILRGASQTIAKSPRCAILLELSLDRWRRQASFGDVLRLCGGGGRRLYAVLADGTIMAKSIKDIVRFCEQSPFREEYILVAFPAEIRRRMPALLRSPETALPYSTIARGS